MSDQAQTTRWTISQTLLGSSDGKNYNRQTLYYGDKPIASFNQRMDAWHADDALALAKIASFLNGVTAEAADEIDRLRVELADLREQAADFGEARDRAAS